MDSIKQLIEKIIIEELNILSERKKFLDLKTFLNLSNNVEKQNKWLEDNAEFVGSGGGRVVYLIDSSKVLKYAQNSFGIKQNKYEAKISGKNNKKEIIAKVYKTSPDYRWIISELVRPLKMPSGKKEFEEKIGVNLNTFLGFVKDEFSEERLKKIKDAFDNIGLYFDYDKVIKNLNKFKDFFANNKIEMKDLDGLSQWGVNTNGNIVLLDYGIDEFS